jgi:hypothetical protein
VGLTNSEALPVRWSWLILVLIPTLDVGSPEGNSGPELLRRFQYWGNHRPAEVAVLDRPASTAVLVSYIAVGVLLNEEARPESSGIKMAADTTI